MTKKLQTHNPTLIQRLLGRNYKWVFLFVNGFKSNNVFIFNDFLYLIGVFCGNFSLFIIYKYFSTNQLLQEIFLNHLFSLFLGFNIILSLSFAIKTGSLSGYLLQPTNIMFRYLVFRIGVLSKTYTFNILFYILTSLVLNINIFNFRLF